MSRMAAPTPADELLQLAWEEVVGDAATRLKQENAHEAFSFSTLTAQLNLMRRQHGLWTGDGLAVLLGRAFWQYWLRHHAAAEPLRSLPFRLLPAAERTRMALDTFAAFVREWSALPCTLRRGADGRLRWEMETLSSQGFFWLGTLAALTAWVSGDKVYPIHFDFSTERPALVIAAHPL